MSKWAICTCHFLLNAFLWKHFQGYEVLQKLKIKNLACLKIFIQEIACPKDTAWWVLSKVLNQQRRLLIRKPIFVRNLGNKFGIKHEFTKYVIFGVGFWSTFLFEILSEKYAYQKESSLSDILYVLLDTLRHDFIKQNHKNMFIRQTVCYMSDM